MNKTFDYETTSTRVFKAILNGYTVMVIRDGNEYECYLKKQDVTGSTPYMYMYSVPREQDPILDVVDLAAVNAESYDFLFEDEHWMTPCSVPIFHQGCMLHECSNCGSPVEACNKFCPECGHKLAWESERTE